MLHSAPLAATLAALVLVASAGCLDAQDAGTDALDDPGVKSVARLTDSYSCGALLVANGGCAAVRLPRLDSLCEGGAQSYAACAVTIEWRAEGGAAADGTRVEAWLVVDGERNVLTCEPPRGGKCAVGDSLDLSHRFAGPDRRHTWDLAFEAHVIADPPMPEAEGWFRLGLDLRLATE